MIARAGARKRRVMRRAARLDCQVVRERDFRLVGSRGLDVSPHGMLVMAQEPILTGEPVIVTFRLPMGLRWFDAQGTIARVVHGRRPGDRGRCLGVEFDGFDQDARLWLEQALRGVPPPLPARDPPIDHATGVRLAARALGDYCRRA